MDYFPILGGLEAGWKSFLIFSLPAVSSLNARRIIIQTAILDDEKIYVYHGVTFLLCISMIEVRDICACTISSRKTIEFVDTGALSVTTHPYSVNFLFEKDTDHSQVHQPLTTLLSCWYFGHRHLPPEILLDLISGRAWIAVSLKYVTTIATRGEVFKF